MAEIIEYIAIKSYTDIEQSKKLAKILPIESADMWHHGFFHPRRMCKIEYNPPAPYHSVTHQWDCPCWSLAALLKVIGNIFKYNLDYNGISFILTVGDFKVSDITAVDASFKMILKLKEESLL